MIFEVWSLNIIKMGILNEKYLEKYCFLVKQYDT